MGRRHGRGGRAGHRARREGDGGRAARRAAVWISGVFCACVAVAAALLVQGRLIDERRAGDLLSALAEEEAATLRLVPLAEEAARDGAVAALQRTLPKVTLAASALVSASQDVAAHAAHANRGPAGSATAAPAPLPTRGAAISALDAFLATGDARHAAAAARALRALAADRRAAVTAARDRLAEARARTSVAWALAAAVWITAPVLGWLVALRPLTRALSRRAGAMRAAMREAEGAAMRDPLTGLPNRAAMQDALARAARVAKRAGRPIGVVAIGLEGLRTVNETLGEAAGDALVRRCAGILAQEARDDDLLGRTGGDEFMLVPADALGESDLMAIAGRLLERLAVPVTSGGETLHLTVDIGVALARPGEPGAARLMANADIALRDAREAGPRRAALYREDRRREVEAGRRTAEALRGALADGRIEPWFQPQIDAEGRLIGFECLARWRHPEEGVLPPGRFLSAAAAAGLLPEIGDAVSRRALAALADWRAEGLEVGRVALNVSAQELRDPAHADRLSWDVDAAGLRPQDVAVEVLESVLLDDHADPLLRTVSTLAARGFAIELDDFGTGHSALESLRRLPVGRVKIDRGFVQGVDASAEQQAFCAAMIGLAHRLGLTALAEGVETEAEAAALRALGIDALQGFLIARPMPREDVRAWLHARQGAPEAAAAG